MRSLHWGVLGTARINRSVIPAIQAGRRSTLTAIASRELSRAETFARDWKIPQAYGSYEDLLADETNVKSVHVIGDESELVERRRPEVVDHAPNIPDRGFCLRFQIHKQRIDPGGVTWQEIPGGVELEGKTGEGRAESIVQVATQAAALFFPRGDDPLA